VYCEDCDIARTAPADSKLDSGVQPWAIDKTAAEALWILKREAHELKPDINLPEDRPRIVIQDQTLLIVAEPESDSKAWSSTGFSAGRNRLKNNYCLKNNSSKIS
jgi:hypothetical protein